LGTETETRAGDRAATAQKLALASSTDAVVLDLADADVVRAEQRAITLASAFAEANHQLAELERQRDAAADEKARRETAAEIESVVEALVEVGTEFAQVTAKLSSVASRVALIIPDGSGLQMFAEQIGASAPTAVNFIGDQLRSHAKAVLNGSVRSGLRQPEIPQTPQAPIPGKQMFSMAALCWPDNTCAKHQQIYLPHSLADKALKLGYALLMDDPKVRSLSRGFSPGPSRDRCVDLTDDNLQPMKLVFGNDVLKVRANFEETRGPNRQSFMAGRGK
jgi:hypothetical protein